MSKTTKIKEHNFIEHPKRGSDVYCLCLSIESLVREEKTSPGIFCDVLAHELAHASPEVFKNPQHNPNEFHLNCSCGQTYHPGWGHDKIWHDKYDEFRERIKNENLVIGSGYICHGKNFKQASLVSISSEEQVRGKISSIAPKLIIVFSFFFLTVGIVAWFLNKRTKKPAKTSLF